MKYYKSERLKKLESELNDLEQWLKLGLVPKRDIPKHKEEIQAITGKIEEEKERLQFLKESGEGEDFVAPKKMPPRPGYSDMPTLPDIEATEAASGSSYGDADYQTETEYGEGAETAATEEAGGDEEEHSVSDEDDESYFSDRNRWKRGGHIVDPDADAW